MTKKRKILRKNAQKREPVRQRLETRIDAIDYALVRRLESIDDRLKRLEQAWNANTRALESHASLIATLKSINRLIVRWNGEKSD